jgi:hypothetical protein
LLYMLFIVCKLRDTSCGRTTSTLGAKVLTEKRGLYRSIKTLRRLKISVFPQTVKPQSVCKLYRHE